MQLTVVPPVQQVHRQHLAHAYFHLSEVCSKHFALLVSTSQAQGEAPSCTLVRV